MSSSRRAARASGMLTFCVVLGVSAAACTSSSPSHAIPSFHPGAGRFRVVPQPSHGAPVPQILTYGGHRLQAGLDDVQGSGKSARASLGFRLQDGGAKVSIRDYRAGDSVQVGPVRVHIDGVYGSGEKHIAVDVTLT